MRLLLGMILGAFFTVAGVFIYDSMSTSTVASGAPQGRTIVNWDVAAEDWGVLKDRTREGWKKITQNLSDKL